MPDVSTWEGLQQALNQKVESMLIDIAEKVRQRWELTIEDLWYNQRPESQYYHRTLQMMNCISIKPILKNGNTWTATIFYDTNKISEVDADAGMFPSHKSIVDGSSFVDNMPNLIEHGNMHGGRPIVEFEGINAQELVEEFAIEYIATVRNELGLNISVN